ncbi:MAG: tRNA pseudouridine(13) synthase TruD, partial [Deltaproteobacteria bacterium]|nr:tRNA pseudouridine(13) synthase TruD [Deltaproteobacteria bacterium]
DATITVRDVEVRTDGDALTVGFTLPGGTYATAVMREVMKVWPLDAAPPFTAITPPEPTEPAVE